MFRFALLVFAMIFARIGYAQFDTSYVHVTRNQFSIYPMAETAYLQTNFSALIPNELPFKSNLKSRTTTSLGFGMSFYRFGFSLSFQLPVTDIPELKKYTAFSFAGGYSYRRFYGELRYRNYRGFEENIVDTSNTQSEYNLRKDIKLRQIGVALYYFTARKYNFDAAFKNYNVQRKSAASFLVIAGGSRFDMSGKYLITDTNHITSDISFVREMDVYSFKLVPGGAFTLVYRNFYLSAMLGVGVNHNTLHIYGDNNKRKKNNFAPVIETRGVIGYNSTNWFASLSLNIEDDFFYYTDVEFSVVNVFFNLKAGYKFDSKYLGKLGKYL